MVALARRKSKQKRMKQEAEKWRKTPYYYFFDWNDEVWFLSTYIAKLIPSFGFILKHYK